MNKDLLIWALQDPRVVRQLLLSLGEKVGQLEDAGFPMEMSSRLMTFCSSDGKVYSVVCFDSRIEMGHYLDDFPLERRRETAIIAFSLWSDTDKFQEERTADDGRKVYIINLDDIVPKDTPTAIRELALTYQGIHLEPETRLGKLLLKTPAGIPHMSMDKNLIIESQHDPRVVQLLMTALQERVGQLELMVTECEPRYLKARFCSAEGLQYSSMQFSSYHDRCLHLNHWPADGWPEKVVLAFCLEGGFGSFSGLCEQGKTRIHTINLDATIPKDEPLAIREMAWLYQGGQFEPDSELGKVIAAVAQIS